MTLALVKRLHPIPVPWTFLETAFYPLIDKSAVSILAMKEYVEDLDDPLTQCDWLGFSMPCPGVYSIRPTPFGDEFCAHKSHVPHGHFVHVGDSGVAILHMAVSSQPFFDCMLGQLPKLGRGFTMSEEQVHVFATLLSTQRAKLVPELLPHERPYLLGNTLVEHVTERLVWVG